ncbi:MAG: glycosyltransferase [Oscillospiraceae bacterium]|nr:glycosyltransferase [Oscillospiraceae bacterium]
MEQKIYPYEFSVITAVYNVEPFLREAVDSLIQQDFGFEKIQLILVDDGSTDGSGAICDEYAREYPNIQVIHKENGGVASARNEGLKYATGRFLNFMDPDDKLTLNTMRVVHSFFIEHEDEIDVATIPIEFFDARAGGHWQNFKFKKGTRVIDLYGEYQSPVVSTCASFFVSSTKEIIKFDSKLVCGEDIKVLLTLLAQKMKLGVVTKCKYMYRRRSTGEASLIQSSSKKVGWYFDYFTYLVDWAVKYYRKQFGYLPAFLQYSLLSDLQWRFKETYNTTGILNEIEADSYKQRLYQSLHYFDDRYILELKQIWIEHKCFMLIKKHSKLPQLTSRNSDALFHFDNTNIGWISRQFSKIDFLTLENDLLTIEGFVKFYGVESVEQFRIYFDVNGQLIPCERIERARTNDYRFDEPLFLGVGFKTQISLEKASKIYNIRLIVKYKNSLVIQKATRFGRFMPIGKEYYNSYYWKDGWIIRYKSNILQIKRCSKTEKLVQELRLLKEVWIKNKDSGRKAVLGRLAYHLTKPFKSKQIWLISDRVPIAGDNGEAFFHYMQRIHSKKIASYFIISKKSPDYKRLKKVGPVVGYLSLKHKLLHLLCDYNISAQADEVVLNPFLGAYIFYRDILQESRFVFLQHGITKDDISGWVNRYNKNFFGFVTAAIPEYNSILDGEYSYTSREIWKTGFPRFDRLYHNEKKYITFLPTWRLYLAADLDSETGIWTLKPGFEKSSYFLFYSHLFNHSKLLLAAKKMGYQLQVMFHPNLRPYTSLFNRNNSVQYLDIDTEYRDIYAQSELVITDYSSACFDFSYLRKPIVYCQFDKEEFFSGEHSYTQGYFDYERDGFGEVEYDLESTVDRIIEYMENGCQLKDKYRERIDKFFAFNDQNNCQRVYEKIIEMDRREKSNDTEAQKVPVSL